MSDIKKRQEERQNVNAENAFPSFSRARLQSSYKQANTHHHIDKPKGKVLVSFCRP